MLEKKRMNIYMTYKNEKLNEVKVFKDPVHRYVHVRDRVIWDLIATPEFQRLRRIKQLGTSNMTFHGAEHSRFNHSLGVYEIVRRIINKFQDKPHWNNAERLLCLCAALLHDLGHGPFSHSFEKVFKLDHEQFTQKIILGDTSVNQILEKVEPGFSQKVADVIGKTYADQLVVSLISSQIDADRMDYLQRDAYYTGVSYGHFDMERIFRVMRPDDDGVVIKSTGMHAVEDYIMSRYQMYWQVYFHPVSISADVILINILQQVNDLFDDPNYTFKLFPKHFQTFFTDRISLEEYIQLDESIMYYYFQQWLQEDDPILKDLCDRFLNRRLFKYVEYNPQDKARVYNRLVELFKLANIDPTYYLVIDKSSDLPYDVYGGLDDRYETMPIYLRMADHTLKELSTHSHIVESISGKRRTDYKLYFPLDQLEKLPDHALKREIFTILAYQL